MIDVLAAAVIALAPHGVDAYAYEETVNLSQLDRTIDDMPMCHMEDGSDVRHDLMPCVWTNDGNAWLTYQDRSYLIIDDTVR